MLVPAIPDPGEPEPLTDPGTLDNPPVTPIQTTSDDLTYPVNGWQAIETLPGGLPGNPSALPPDVGPVFLSVPTLNMLGTVVLPFTAQAVSSGGSGAAPSSNGPITVQLGTVYSAAQTILNQVTSLVSEYDSLAQTTETDLATPNFFGQDATATVFEPVLPTQYQTEQPTVYPTGDPAPTVATIPDVLIQYYARTAQPGLIADMYTALTGVADALEGIGQFIVALTNAGDAYATADSASATS